MMPCFEGKRILVTGACQGIGRGIAIELWKQGAKVVAVSDNQQSLEKLKNEFRSIETVCLDICDWNKTREVIGNLGVLHGVVNNAGIVIMEPFLECSLKNFDAIWQMNVRAVLNVSQIVADIMIREKCGGSIVNISSQASKAPLKDHVAYCVSKGAVDAMTRVMALELGHHNIRVNTVNPTVVMSELGQRALPDPTKEKGIIDEAPLGRFGVVENVVEVEDVVNAVIFLLSDASTMINGAHLPVDGGFAA